MGIFSFQSATHRTNRNVPARLLKVAGILAAGALLGQILWRPNSITVQKSSGKDIVVLKEIQQLGRLQAAEHSFADYLSYEQHGEPRGWPAAIPGVNHLVHAATKANVEMKVSGKVTASTDLSLIKAKTDSVGRLTLELPEPTLDEPTLDLNIVKESRAMFARQPDLIPDAMRHAKSVLKSSARQLGLIETAKSSSEKTIRSIALKLNVKVPSIRWVPSTANDGADRTQSERV